jgi:hypothetical protein
MEINVSVDKIDLAEEIASHYDDDGSRIPSGTFADLIAYQLVQRIIKTDDYTGLVGRVRTIRDEEIREAVLPAITEAIQAPIQTTNRYGEATGTSTTLRELIAEAARTVLTSPVDNYSREKGTLLQKVIREEVAAAFKAELVDAVKQVRDGIATEMGTTVAELVTSAVRDAMRAR